MKSVFPDMVVEDNKNNRNLVLGDVSSAKVLLTAHCDTCVKMPFPNFITPTNFWVYLGYQILIVIPFVVLMFLVESVVLAITQAEYLSLLAGYFAMLGALYYLIVLNKPAMKQYTDAFHNAFPETAEKAVYVESTAKALSFRPVQLSGECRRGGAE